MFRVSPVTVAAKADDTPAVQYKKLLCLACHTATASKHFDPTKPESELIQVILKGKKSADPKVPSMPAFEAKAITEEGAKALVDYMKTLRPPAN